MREKGLCLIQVALRLTASSSMLTLNEPRLMQGSAMQGAAALDIDEAGDRGMFAEIDNMINVQGDHASDAEAAPHANNAEAADG